MPDFWNIEIVVSGNDWRVIRKAGESMSPFIAFAHLQEKGQPGGSTLFRSMGLVLSATSA